MKKWSYIFILIILVLVACVPVSDQPADATMPLPASELTRAALAGETPGVGATASPTASLTSTITATPDPTATATILPTLTSPPTDQPTLPPTETATGTAPPADAQATPGDQGGPPQVVIKVDHDLVFTAPDGLELRASLYKQADEPGPLPGVMILPMHIESREVWGPFAGLLAAEGYAVLTVDLQSRVDSSGLRNWVRAVDDFRMVWQEFVAREDVDESRTGLVGSSLGANLALAVAAAEPSIGTVVLLSPGLDYYGLKSVDVIEAYGARPILLLFSSNDQPAADAVGALVARAQGEVLPKAYEGVAHGSVLFFTQPGAPETIARWLEDKVKRAEPPAPAVAPGLSVTPLFLFALIGALGILLLGALAYLLINRIGPPAEVADLLTLDKLKYDRDLVQLEGQIVEVPEPLDKDEAKPLVALRLLIEEYDPENGWKVRFDGLKSTPFWLMEPQGKIWIQADELDKRYLGPGFHASTRQAEQALQILGHTKNAAWGKGLRYKMWELHLGQQVSVSGQVRRRLELIPSSGQPLAVVPMSEAGGTKIVQVAPGMSGVGTLVALLVLGLTLICAGGIGIVITILNWMR